MKTKSLTLTALFTALMCAVSFFRMPLFFTPVPLTLQLPIALITGALLGGKYGALSMLVYVLLGAFGLPVFSGLNAGVGYIFGPTGGFLLGFIPAAFVAGKLSKTFGKYNEKPFVAFAGTFSAFAIATITLYLCGIVHFSVVMETTILRALSLAVLPFMWVDLLKIIIAAIVVRQFALTDVCGTNTF